MHLMVHISFNNNNTRNQVDLIEAIVGLKR
jgi:hypothetical protein